jgi:hypothetical protein
VYSFLILFEIFALFPELSPFPRKDAWTEYKSSALGFSLKYPSDWERYRLVGCGGGGNRLTPEEGLETSLGVLALHLPGDVGHLTVSIHRKWTQRGHDWAMRPDTPFVVRGMDSTRWHLSSTLETNSGIQVEKNVSLSEDAPNAGFPDSIYATYGMRGGERLVILNGSIIPSAFARWESMFDRIARSIEFLDQLPPRNDDSSWNTFVGAGFSFEYPADWIVSWPHDDAEIPQMGIDRPVSINAAEPAGWLLTQTPTIVCNLASIRSRSPDSFDDLLAHMLNWLVTAQTQTSSTSYLDVQHAKYEAASGQEGFKLWFISRFDWHRVKLAIPTPNGSIPLLKTRHRRETKYVMFALERPDGRVQVLTYTCPLNDYEKLKPIIEHGGMTFRVWSDAQPPE